MKFGNSFREPAAGRRRQRPERIGASQGALVRTVFRVALLIVATLAGVGCAKNRFVFYSVASGERLLMTAKAEGSDVVARVEGRVEVYREAECLEGRVNYQQIRNEKATNEIRKYRCGLATKPAADLTVSSFMNCGQSGCRAVCNWKHPIAPGIVCPGAAPKAAPARVVVTAEIRPKNGAGNTLFWKSGLGADGSARFHGVLPIASRLADFCGGAEVHVVADPPPRSGFVYTPGDEPLGKHPDLPWRPYVGLRPSAPSVMQVVPSGKRSLKGLAPSQISYLKECDPQVRRNACLAEEDQAWKKWHARVPDSCRQCAQSCSANTGACISRCDAAAPEAQWRSCKHQCLMTEYWKCFADCRCQPPPTYGTACR